MNKTSIIIRREYLTRVRKKSFIVMTLLTPVLFAALMIVPVWFATMEDEDVKQIAVLDSSQLFVHKIPATDKYKFTYATDVQLEDFKKNLSQTEFFGILYIPPYITYIPSGTEFFSYKQPPVSLTMHIANAIEKTIETEKLKAHHIENLDEILKSVRTHIDIRTFRMSEDGGKEKENHGILNMIVAYAAAFLIYFFVFMFGSQVMRGVIEEKTNRIVEVIVSSVKPFQLLMGKVIGVALVGLTQFVIWVTLTMLLVVVAQQLFLSGVTDAALQQAGSTQISSLAGNGLQNPEVMEHAGEFLSMLQSINFGVLIGSFLFYFLGGYLLYGSLFAAIGSAVDAETDTQQFMLPITIPLILAIMVMINAMQNPDGALAFWFSIIPFTSPVVMMARIPFGVPYWELALSMALLVATFTGAIWLSAKIYRTGILVYGKKLTWAELWKWLRYSNK
ncbi:MAG: ABC transporter permease [Bacteroidales bacterium]|jgi:ABC-2 type transport system permease protein|nr:ABC transporter permease [Bacteroidales bacterium]